MSTAFFLALLFGLPVLLFAFAARRFRRFCLIVCLPLAALSLIVSTGPHDPTGLLLAIPFAIVPAALLVELAVFIRGRICAKLAHG